MPLPTILIKDKASWFLGKKVTLDKETFVNQKWGLRILDFPGSARHIIIKLVLIPGKLTGITYNKFVVKTHNFDNYPTVELGTVSTKDCALGIGFGNITMSHSFRHRQCFKVRYQTYTPAVVVSQTDGRLEKVLFHAPFEVVEKKQQPRTTTTIPFSPYRSTRKHLTKIEQENFGNILKKGAFTTEKVRGVDGEVIEFVRNGCEIILKKDNEGFEFGNVEAKEFVKALVEIRRVLGYRAKQSLKKEHKNTFVAEIFELEREIESETFVDVLEVGRSLHWKFDVVQSEELPEIEKLRNDARETVYKVLDDFARQFGFCCLKTQCHLQEILKCKDDTETEPCHVFWKGKYYSNQKIDQVCCDRHFSKKRSGQAHWTKKVLEVLEDDYINCSICLQKSHKRCTSYGHDGSEFVCDFCFTGQTKEVINTSWLVETKCTDFIQFYISELTKKLGIEIVLRTFYSIEKSGEFSKEDKEDFENLDECMPKSAYTEKMFGVFQMLDGRPLLIAVYIFQEFGTLNPNTSRNSSAVLEYVDTNMHLQLPENDHNNQLRVERKNGASLLYHEILLAYYHYMRDIGYTKYDLYVCPPLKYGNYLFLGRSQAQRYLSLPQLKMWYQRMVDEGLQRGIFAEGELKNAPWCEETKEKIFQALYSKGGFWVDRLDDYSRSKKLDLPSLVKKIKKVEQENEDSLLYFEAERTKRHFQLAVKEEEIPNTLFNSRDSFMEFQRQNRLQFDTLQNAMYSTAQIIHMVSQQQAGLNGSEPSTSSQ